jgi:hypothetical protein
VRGSLADYVAHIGLLISLRSFGALETWPFSSGPICIPRVTEDCMTTQLARLSAHRGEDWRIVFQLVAGSPRLL